MPMRTIVTALALLAQMSPIVGQQPAFVVGRRSLGLLGSTMLSSSAWVA